MPFFNFYSQSDMSIQKLPVTDSHENANASKRLAECVTKPRLALSTDIKCSLTT
jgi:hypothetical protein